MHPSATRSNRELLVTLPWVRLWGNGKEKTGKGGKQHSGCCGQSQAPPLASAGLVKLQLVCASSGEGKLAPDTGDAPTDVLFPNTDTTQNNPAKANTRVLTYRTWVDNTFKVVNEEKHVEISCKVPASELFGHLKNQNISSLAFMGKKKSGLRSKQNFIPQNWLVLIQIPSGFFSPTSSEDHCSLSYLGSSFDCVLLSC